METGFTAVRGTVTALDGDGLWLRDHLGRERRAEFSTPEKIAALGHRVEVAGIDSPAGLQGGLLANQTSGETWFAESYEDLSWGTAIGRVLLSELLFVLMMAMPLINLFAGFFLGLRSMAEAIAYRGFWRFVLIVLLVFPLLGVVLMLLTRSKDMFVIWYFVGCPLAYVLARASVLKSIDEARGRSRDAMNRALEQLRSAVQE